MMAGLPSVGAERKTVMIDAQPPSSPPSPSPLLSSSGYDQRAQGLQIVSPAKLSPAFAGGQ